MYPWLAENMVLPSSRNEAYNLKNPKLKDYSQVGQQVTILFGFETTVTLAEMFINFRR